MRIAIAALTAATLAATAPLAAAQVVVNDQGVRTGGMVVDSSGVHMPGMDVTSGGVRTRSTTVTTTTRHMGAQRSGSATASLQVLDNHRTASLDCRGGTAEVVGNDNTLTLSHCSRLSLPGNHNHIVVSLVGPAAVDVVGNGNTISYRGERGVRPSTNVVGSGNHVASMR